MEHLCKGCIEMLKEHWGYIADEIEVMVVEREECDNTYIGRDIDPYSPGTKRTYPYDSKIITIKKGELK